MQTINPCLPLDIHLGMVKKWLIGSFTWVNVSAGNVAEFGMDTYLNVGIGTWWSLASLPHIHTLSTNLLPFKPTDAPSDLNERVCACSSA